jgi:microcystin synthetase protein McyJ
MDSSITEEIAKFYTQRHANRDVIYGDKPYANFGYWTRPDMTINDACDALTDLVAGAAGLAPGDRVLEVGCGYGASAVYYTQRYRPASVIGLDVTEIRIQSGRAYIAEHGLADIIQIRLGDAVALDFTPGSFTKVLAIECAFHFDTRRDFFREAARVLAPGGVLALTDVIPKPGIDRERFLQRLPPITFDISLDVPDNVYDIDVYRDYLREAGFVDVRIDNISDRTMPFFADYLERLGSRTEGEKGVKLLRAAQRNREHVAAISDYLLVSARKANG